MGTTQSSTGLTNQDAGNGNQGSGSQGNGGGNQGNGDHRDGGDGERGKTKGFVPSFEVNTPSSAKDPLERYMNILKDPDLSDEQKDWLIDRAKRRFQNRRRMAYIALTAILAMMAVVVGGAVVDGIGDTEIVAKMQKAANLLGGINVLLTTIVGAYYGSSSFRPSS